MTLSRRSLGLGQALSVLNAVLGACATLLAGAGFAAPAAQNAAGYLLLALLCPFARRARKKQAALQRHVTSLSPPWTPPPPAEGEPLVVVDDDCGGRGGEEGAPAASWWWWHHTSWLWYVALAVVDVEANYCIVLAYQYTTITSVMLLDNLTIPCVMVLSIAVLKAEYSKRHALGAALAFVGVACTILSDVLPPPLGWGEQTETDPEEKGGWWFLPSSSSSSSRVLLGDALCVASCVLYAMSNVAQETYVKRRGGLSFLNRFGAAGFLVSAAQACALERPELSGLANSADHHLRGRTLALAAGYAIAMAAFYVGTMHFLAVADATYLNLSLLTSDAYALLFSALVQHTLPPPLYFVALLITAAGVGVYQSTPPPTTSSGADGASAHQLAAAPTSSSRGTAPSATTPSDHGLYTLLLSSPTPQSTAAAATATDEGRRQDLHA